MAFCDRALVMGGGESQQPRLVVEFDHVSQQVDECDSSLLFGLVEKV